MQICFLKYFRYQAAVAIFGAATSTVMVYIKYYVVVREFTLWLLALFNLGCVAIVTSETPL